MKLVLMMALLVLSASSCSYSSSTTTTTNERSTPPPQSAAGSAGESSATAPTPQPNDQAAVLRELIDVENRWKTAKYKGDLTTLNTIFADEFTNVAENGKTYTKAQWVALWKRGNPAIKSWNFSDERLESNDGNKATITFIYTTTDKRAKTSRVRDTDTFIKRDGRWQVLASQSKNL